MQPVLELKNAHKYGGDNDLRAEKHLPKLALLGRGRAWGPDPRPVGPTGGRTPTPSNRSSDDFQRSSWQLYSPVRWPCPASRWIKRSCPCGDIREELDTEFNRRNSPPARSASSRIPRKTTTLPGQPPLDEVLLGIVVCGAVIPVSVMALKRLY